MIVIRITSRTMPTKYKPWRNKHLLELPLKCSRCLGRELALHGLVLDGAPRQQRPPKPGQLRLRPHQRAAKL